MSNIPCSFVRIYATNRIIVWCSDFFSYVFHKWYGDNLSLFGDFHGWNFGLGRGVPTLCFSVEFLGILTPHFLEKYSLSIFAFHSWVFVHLFQNSRRFLIILFIFKMNLKVIFKYSYSKCYFQLRNLKTWWITAQNTKKWWQCASTGGSGTKIE